MKMNTARRPHHSRITLDGLGKLDGPKETPSLAANERVQNLNRKGSNRGQSPKREGAQLSLGSALPTANGKDSSYPLAGINLSVGCDLTQHSKRARVHSGR